LKKLAQQIPPEIQNLALKLKQIEEQLRLVITRRQQIKAELMEIEIVKEELEKIADDAFVHKMVGNILIKIPKKTALEEINEKKETLQLQDMTLDKQENILRKQYESTSKELEEMIKKSQLGGQLGSIS
jgi:prefoldin, beta subunit, archaeal